MTKKLLGVTAVVLAAMLFTARTLTSQPASTPDPSEISEASALPPLSSAARPESSFMKVEHSADFSVEYMGNGVKLVTDADDRKLLLVPRGQEAPAGYEGAAVIETPVRRALFSSVTQVGMLRPYNVWDNISGIITGTGSFETMDQEIAASGADIAYAGRGNAPDYELIQSLEPDIAFVFTGRSAQVELIAKLEELGIPYAVDNEYMEEHPMGRMEWTKFLAAFFNKDDEAEQFADSQIKLMEEMEARIAGAGKPKVMWASLSPKNGVVYAAGDSSFVGGQMRLAGCEYVFPQGGQITVEEFYSELLDAETWIYSSGQNYMPDYNELIEAMPVIKDAPAVVNRNVWQFHEDYYYFTDQAAQQIIELAAIFHPELYPDYEFFHYIPLAE